MNLSRLSHCPGNKTEDLETHGDRHVQVEPSVDRRIPKSSNSRPVTDLSRGGSVHYTLRHVHPDVWSIETGPLMLGWWDGVRFRRPRSIPCRKPRLRSIKRRKIGKTKASVKEDSSPRLTLQGVPFCLDSPSLIRHRRVLRRKMTRLYLGFFPRRRQEVLSFRSSSHRKGIGDKRKTRTTYMGV